MRVASFYCSYVTKKKDKIKFTVWALKADRPHVYELLLYTSRHLDCARSNEVKRIAGGGAKNRLQKNTELVPCFVFAIKTQSLRFQFLVYASFTQTCISMSSRRNHVLFFFFARHIDILTWFLLKQNVFVKENECNKRIINALSCYMCFVIFVPFYHRSW